jgi:hypothetical protein
MTRTRYPVAATLAAVIVCAGCGASTSPATPSSAALPASSPVEAGAAVEIAIEVAPNVLNLQSQGEVVTIHTSLAYSAVAGSGVTLNGVPIAWWKADNRGQFVAKFDMNAIKNLPVRVGEYNALRIEGTKTDATRFWGEKAILVVDNASGK